MRAGVGQSWCCLCGTCFPNPFPAHTPPPRLTWNDRCSESCLFQGTTGSGGTQREEEAPWVPVGGSQHPPQVLPTHLRIPPSHSPISSSSAFFIPMPQPTWSPSAPPPPFLVSALWILPAPVQTPSSCSPPPSGCPLPPHACTLRRPQRAPALQLKEANISGCPMLPLQGAGCWGDNRPKAVPPSWNSREEKVNKGVIEVNTQV